VVYTNTQIAGALQGLLVAIPLHILKIPESPILFLNLLSFGSLAFFAWYISKRVPAFPAWLIWILVLTTPWTMHYSTRVVNPSYALVFSVPFFVAFLELLPLYSQKIIRPGIAFFIMGATTTCIMQLHMSYVLLIPYTGFVFYEVFKKSPKQLLTFIPLYLAGILLGAATLIPTILHPDLAMQSTSSNIVFNAGNAKNIMLVLMRFLSFASFEIPYMLGGSTATRLAVIGSQIWMAPFAALLLITGFLQVAFFMVLLFVKKSNAEWRAISQLTLVSWLLIFVSFFFSIKGPSSHTFYLMLPIPVFYSFYCYQWLITKRQLFLQALKVIALCGLFFHAGLGMYNYRHKSLYVNRARAEQAIAAKDYKILGLRRADTWGYGY
jgi:hypothetical protein